ncbi:MAG: GNAT family N-acetyltransferase [Methanomassiliicoccus sp.]|nr:GNAT family N-acetyltransferase [Methanomassiliicoccus sp.]
MIFRTAGIEDLPELQRIEESCFQEERYPPEVLAEILLDGDFETILAEEDELVGAATINCGEDLAAAQLASIAVLPPHRGKGIGRALLDEAEGRARGRGRKIMVLQVNVHNVAAINLYLHRGYIIEGMIGDYYGPGRDAYFMDKML